MKEYLGKISGIGNSTTRNNEITADDLAILRNYIYGWEYGVINREGWNFNATPSKDKSSVIVDKGIMFVYGYFGIFPETYTIPFIKPSATQYRFIYAEIDRSVVPNTCTLKVKNNQGSDKIKPNTFRQDYLMAIRTGVFQLPLWRVELNSEGIVEIVDVRELKDYIMKVHHTNNTTKRITKEILVGATATTPSIMDKSEKLATPMFTHSLAKDYILTAIACLTARFNNVQSSLLAQVSPLTLYFHKYGKQKDYFTITCASNVSCYFMIDASFLTIVENEVVVTEENGIKTIIIPIQANFDDAILENYNQKIGSYEFVIEAIEN